MSHLTIKEASPSDFEKIEDLFIASCNKQQALQCTDIWPKASVANLNLQEKQQAGRLFSIDVNGQFAGSFSLAATDEIIWPESKHANDAIYINKFMLHEKFTGMGITQKAISWIAQFSKNSGYSYLRLDCYNSADKLKLLYEKVGFTPSGTEKNSEGVLMQRYELPLKKEAF